MDARPATTLYPKLSRPASPEDVTLILLPAGEEDMKTDRKSREEWKKCVMSTMFRVFGLLRFGGAIYVAKSVPIDEHTLPFAVTVFAVETLLFFASTFQDCFTLSLALLVSLTEGVIALLLTVFGLLVTMSSLDWAKSREHFASYFEKRQIVVQMEMGILILVISTIFLIVTTVELTFIEKILFKKTCDKGNGRKIEQEHAPNTFCP